MKKNNSKRLEKIGNVIGVFLGILILSFFLGDETPSVKESSEPIDNERKVYRRPNINTPGVIPGESMYEQHLRQQRHNDCVWGRVECDQKLLR